MKVVRLVFGMLAVVGSGLLAGGIYSVRHTRQFLQAAVTAPGVVVENVWREDTTSNGGTYWAYYPRVRFRTSDGQDISFISSVGASPPSYRVSEPVTILYDPRQPYSASINSFGSLWAASIVLLGMGVIFTAPGIGFIVWKRASNRKNQWLHLNGRRIQADIARVELNTSLTVNGSSPYRIVCQWLDPASNQMHVFHSANIWYDPTHYLPGKALEVLVDPNNLHRYTVETSFLPKVG
ncbi:MAG TPA: DUF3592 domain-containing protein [Bryobacteraceae bacterium]|nr:DUF3592 domain-containing protein [Bryobacteraceae bacterium]